MAARPRFVELVVAAAKVLRRSGRRRSNGNIRDGGGRCIVRQEAWWQARSN
jgi:hypothetical protein